MKVYQCIHKYPPHIQLFEKKYGVTDDMDFDTLRRLVIEDGYAVTYILKPALENKSKDVFYTLWNYERMQWKWADEHGLKSRDLDEIKLAQLEEFQPDVFYNMSAVYDGNFLKRLGKRKERKDVYWNAIIQSEPISIPDYDGQLSLHRPYIEFWRRHGMKALELQPGIPASWATFEADARNIDVLFYGQYFRGMFDNRNRLIEDLLRYKMRTGRDIRCHLTYMEYRQTIFRIPRLPWTRIRSPFVTFPSKIIRRNALLPLYGDTLYHTIAKSRIVVNAYTDDNHEYKSNMRLFEAIGLGAFLISEEGNYPDGFEPGIDFYTYRDSAELIAQVERVLEDWPEHAAVAERTRKKITALYNKDRQWFEFKSFVETL